MSSEKPQVAPIRKLKAGSKPEHVPIVAEEILVTPEMAFEWLAEKNKRNRGQKPATLARYVRAIKEKRWIRTGDTIKFDPNGNLLDGQHRLQAIFETERAQYVLVAYNVPPESFAHIDTGAVRAGGDVLSIAGYENPKNLAALVRFANHLEKVGEGRMAYTSIGKTRLDNDRILEWLAQHPEVEDSLDIACSRAAQAVLSPPSLFRALHWYLRRVEANDAEAFFEGLSSGVGLVSSDPVFMLRSVLIQEKARARVAGTRPYWYWAAITIKAWNAYRDGKPVKQLRFASGGQNRETWPEPR